MTSSGSRESPNNPRVISQLTTSDEIKIYCWNFRGLGAVGHISMRLSDGTYISHWPDKVLKLLLKRPATQMTYDDDIELEGREPDHVKSIPASNLDEDKIKLWWAKFLSDAGSKYNFISQNCAHIISKAVQVGLVHSKYHAKGKRLRKRLFKMPIQTLKEILGLFKEWPKNDYLKFNERLLTFAEEFWSAADHFYEEIKICDNNADTKSDFDTMADLNMEITKFCKYIDNFTQEVTAAFEEISLYPEPTQRNAIKSMQSTNKQIQKSLLDFLERISFAETVDETICSECISFLDDFKEDIGDFFEKFNKIIIK